MNHYVYILKTINGYVNRSYVGYSTNLASRLKNITHLKEQKQHVVISGKLFIKKFSSKSKAMSFEYFLKKDRKKDYPY